MSHQLLIQIIQTVEAFRLDADYYVSDYSAYSFVLGSVLPYRCYLIYVMFSIEPYGLSVHVSALFSILCSIQAMILPLCMRTQPKPTLDTSQYTTKPSELSGRVKTGAEVSMSLLTENGNTKDDLRLPTDDTLLSQVKGGFEEGKDLILVLMSAMGKEQICSVKDIGKN
ncbi:Eukaryotic translation initiation factor 5A-4 [Capsicum annuum]|nr:Eukaryotic translation initiation factor 5A-4 [Capsicum annuum]KAF3662313.1 Eukaryotic translation initiation factor 5A-4 [Capsicum annuum]